MFTGASHGEAACPPMYGAAGNVAREGLRFRGDARSRNGRGDRNVAREGALSGRREVMRRARRRECRARGCAFSLRGTAGQRPRKPGTRGAAWSSSKACHAEMRHLSRHSPSTRPVRFSVCRRTGHGGGFPGGFPGASRGTFRGLFRDFSGGLHRELGARKCDVYPKHGPSTAGRTFSVCHRTGRGVVFIEGMPRRNAASISA